MGGAPRTVAVTVRVEDRLQLLLQQHRCRGLGDAHGVHARRPLIGPDPLPRPIDEALVDLKRLHLRLWPTHQLLPHRVGRWATWPARPLRSSPITGPSSLL